MKKLILAITAMAGASLAAYAQGSVTVGDSFANGNVIVDPAGHTSTSTASYVLAPTFTVQLWALPGNVSTTAGVTGLDAYGYLTVDSFLADGFMQVSNVGNTTGSNGLFNQPIVANVVGSLGAYPYSAAGSDVLALVGWTGTFANLTTALANSASYGILAFVNPLGPGGGDSHIPDVSVGWNNLANSPASAANGGSQDFILSPVPEPSTLALASLVGLASLMAIRRKKV